MCIYIVCMYSPFVLIVLGWIKQDTEHLDSIKPPAARCQEAPGPHHGPVQLQQLQGWRPQAAEGWEPGQRSTMILQYLEFPVEFPNWLKFIEMLIWSHLPSGYD